MDLTESISIFSSRAISKNASTVLATPVHLGKCGANTMFWADINASGGGTTSITYQVGDTPEDTFYTPSNASKICASFTSSLGDATRDRYRCSIMGTEWIKFKALENNASPVTLDMNLVVSK